MTCVNRSSGCWSAQGRGTPKHERSVAHAISCRVVVAFANQPNEPATALAHRVGPRAAALASSDDLPQRVPFRAASSGAQTKLAGEIRLAFAGAGRETELAGF